MQTGHQQLGNLPWQCKGQHHLSRTSGFLIADASLCYLPMQNMGAIYTYLLKQNFHNKGMTFALKDNNIVISSLIYDQHMHFETCKKLLIS